MTAIKKSFAASVSRRAVRMTASTALGFGILMAAGSHTQTLVANGDTRTLTMIHRHTGEEIIVTFKRNGRYDQDALNKLNWFLRDWRRDEPTRMDPHLFDIVWEVYRSVGGQSPINVVSAYRSAGTNAMLRRRSRAVAQFSQHINGRAMDFYIPGASMTRVREAGMILQRGGVGFYPGSANQFVHMDTGSVRHWPKASREYLARLFPDGRTVHIPADGRPMPGFDAALAMVQARGGSASRFYDSRQDEGTSFDDGDDRGGVVRQRGNSMGLFASLFGGGNAAREEAPQQQARPALRGRAAAQPQQPAEAAPGIPARPAEPVPTTAAPTTVVAAAQPARAGAPVQLTPAQPPRMLIAAAPIPMRAPPAAVRMRGDEAEEATQIAAAPLPMARPTIGNGAESVAVAAFTAPEPLPRPEPNRPMPLPETTQVAAAPMPAARPQVIGGSQVAQLPALITTGDQRGRTEPAEAAPGMALAFASPTQRVTLPNAPSAGPQPRITAEAPAPVARPAAPAPAAARPAHPPQLAARTPAPQVLRTARAPMAVPPLVAPSTEGPRGRVVFTRQTTERASAVVALSTPDPRQQKLIEHPTQVVAMTFSQGAPATVPTQRFSGQAVASLRTVDFAQAEQPTRASLLR